jgi:glycosyltransferase involved in cell wall biosynthesis
MRVWLVQRAESTPHDENGARRLMRMGILADVLQSQGHTVVWWTSAFDHVSLSFRFRESARLEVKENYFIQYLKSFGYQKSKSLSRLIDSKVVAYQFAKESVKDQNRPDVILVSMPSIELAYQAVIYANKRDIPVFVDIRDLWPDVFRDLLPKYLGWFVELAIIPMKKTLAQLCKNATAITGITEDFVNWGVQYSGRPKRDADIPFPMAYVRNKVDRLELDKAYTFWEKLGVVSEAKVMYGLFLGTFTRSFDFETIFTAAERLENKKVPIKFIFCGVGAKEKSIKSACSRLDNCIFSGWVNAAQIQSALELSDIGLAPYIESPNYIGNIPNKPAEYMSEGLVIASSLVKGALFELLENKKCGFTYGVDPDLLVEYLTKLSNDKNELESMQKSARELFESQFDGKQIYESMVSYLEKGIKQNAE